VCGLLGLICATENDAASAREAVGAALRCQRHRGPDETDTWADGEVVYGFNRLGFIDLEHSHQPLRWGPPENRERYALTFNGEVYNYLELRAELRAEHGAEFGDAPMFATEESRFHGGRKNWKGCSRESQRRSHAILPRSELTSPEHPPSPSKESSSRSANGRFLTCKALRGKDSFAPQLAAGLS